MSQEFPFVDLPIEVIAWPDVNEETLNLYRQSCRLQCGIFCICLEGHMKATINLIEYEIHRNDLTVLIPGDIIEFKTIEEKIHLAFIGFSASCLHRINLFQKLSPMIDKIREYPIMRLNDRLISYLFDYITLFSKITINDTQELSNDLSVAVLNTMLAGMEMFYQRYELPVRDMNRKEEIYKEFIQLVSEHYLKERRAQFYADRLGISLQHLSTTVKQVSGKNVLEIIAYIVITDAKAKLKSTEMTIQQIAYALNFPNASFFGKYFKRYTGMTPMAFRNR